MTTRRTYLKLLALQMFFTAIAQVCAGTSALRAEDGSESIPVTDIEHAGEVDFQKEILPILRKNCLACHNQTDAEAGLVLETPATIRRGGDSGAAVSPNDSAGSLLLKVAAHRIDPVMPPEDNDVRARNLTSEELGLVKLWIDQGARGKVRNYEPVQLTPPPQSLRPVYALAMTSYGDYVAASRANQIVVFHIPTQQRVATLSDPELAEVANGQPAPAHVDLVQSLTASPDGNTFASGGFRTVKIWRREPMSVQHELDIFDHSGSGDDESDDGNSVFALSNDGKYAAVARRDGAVGIYDFALGHTVRSFASPAGSVRQLQFSPDGSRLISGGADRAVRLWNVEKDRELMIVDVSDRVTSVCFLSDGVRFAAGRTDGTIKVWNSDRADQTVIPLKGHHESITGLVAIAGTDNRLASSSRDKTVRIWNVDSGQTIRQIDLAAPVVHLAVSPDGKTLAAVDEDGRAKLFHTADGKQLADLRTNVREDRDTRDARRTVTVAERLLFWSEYDRNEAAATVKRAEQTVKRRASALQKLIEQGKSSTDSEYQAAVEALAFHAADLKQLAAVVVAAEVVISKRREKLAAVRLALQDAEQLAANPSAPIRQTTFAADGKRLAATDGHGRIHTFAVPDGTAIDLAEALDGNSLDSIAYASDGRLITQSGDHKVQFWQTGKWSHQLSIGSIDSPQTLVDRVTAVAFSPDGKLLATGGGESSRSGELKIWDAQTGNRVRTIEGAHSDAVLGLEFSREGIYLASCGSDRNMRVFEVATGKRIRSFEYHTSHVLGVSWRADGRVLATAGADNVVRTWNFKTATEHKSIKRFDDKEVTGVQFLGTGGDFVVSAANNSVSLWNYNGGGGRRYEGVKSFMYAICASVDGKTIAAGGHDGVVHVWNRDGKRLAKFE